MSNYQFMMTLFWVFSVHTLSDFVLQTDWQAKNKSSNWHALLMHIGVYSWVSFMLLMPFFTNILDAASFLFITFFAHGLTDAVTSRLVKHFHKKGDTHNLFVVIGFDQLAHIIQLTLCVYWFIL